ncbi:MAG: YceD family protein [Bryobacteraceae bacterium]
MFLNVQELLLRSLPIAEVFPPGAIDYFDAYLRQASDLRVTGVAELRPTTMEIRVKGHLEVLMEADCDRCLEPASFPIALDFDLIYQPLPPVMPEEVVLTPEDTEIAFYRGLGIELVDVVREQVLLALPMQRLCRPDCRGICPVCGENRNLVDCHCRQEWLDDRWAALRNFVP